MKAKYLAKHLRIQQQLQGRGEYDPLRTARSQSNAFNRSWLKSGESMTLTQRAGHTLFSLIFIGIGLSLCRASIVEMLSGDVMFPLFALASLFFLLFGGLGLKNVLRFRRNKTII
jgi:hypothetical protein